MEKVRKGDQVIVISGKDKGKKGEVIKVLTKLETVMIKNVNMVKKAVKKSKDHPAGGFMEIEAPLHLSNVMVFCPKCGKGTRIGVSISDKGKTRVCKKCNQKFE
jgi:large subunit ribosomal protein L24